MSKFKGELCACIAVLTAATGTALAQSPDESQAVPPDQGQGVEPMPQQQPAQQQPLPATVPPEDYQYESEPGTWGSMKRVGFSLSLGGGVADFTDSEMRDTTGVAGTWAVRATIGTKSLFGFEASYIGSASSIDALGLDDSAVLVSNGLQGALRLNAVLDAPVTPFIFGGVAWSRFDITNTDRNTSALDGEDNVFEIPVGLGIGGSYMGFGYDIRGELRFATEDNMVPELTAGRATGDFADMHRWGVNATLGYGF